MRDELITLGVLTGMCAAYAIVFLMIGYRMGCGLPPIKFAFKPAPKAEEVPQPTEAEKITMKRGRA